MLAVADVAEALSAHRPYRDALGPDDVDVIVLHGVYSWVGARNRQHIVDIIRRRLRAPRLRGLTAEREGEKGKRRQRSEGLVAGGHRSHHHNSAARRGDNPRIDPRGGFV